MKPNQARSTEERFWKRVQKTDTCWLWLMTDGSVSRRYGRLRVGSRSDGTRDELLMHWYSWELHNGSRTPGLQVLHHCDVQACVRPEHLYEGTHKDNMRDVRVRKRTSKAQQTHCLRGHEFTAENTYMHKNGTRHCQECRALARNRAKRGALDAKRMR